jgi:hypothetical protein
MTRIFIILFLLISFSLKGQNTSGTVSDTTNGKKIVGASIQSMPDATDLQTVEVLGRSAKDYNSEYSFRQPASLPSTKTFRSPFLMNANDPANPDLLVTRGSERSRGKNVLARRPELPSPVPRRSQERDAYFDF